MFKASSFSCLWSERFSFFFIVYLRAYLWYFGRNNFHDRRSVAASLVQGVYVLERDRQQNRQDPLAHAPPWWEFFNFHLVRILVDDVDNSIFGAIYEYKFSHFNHNYSAQNSPHYVIAFRGTMTKSNTRSRDLKLDFLCVRNRLNESSRFQLAMQTVESIFVVAGNSRIWLTRHSVGSAISLLIGKNVTKMGYNVEAYLFNPPFLSAPVEGIKNEKLKHGIRFTSSVVKAGLAVAVKGRNHRPDKDDPFSSLSSWKPYLFVNPADFVCSGYIGYFEHRKTMEKIGAGKIEKIATQNSMGNLLSSSEQRGLEPLHLIPSAYLTINLRHSPNFKHAHGIHQWWDQSFIGLSELHEYDPYVVDEKLLLRTLHEKSYIPDIGVGTLGYCNWLLVPLYHEDINWSSFIVYMNPLELEGVQFVKHYIYLVHLQRNFDSLESHAWSCWPHWSLS